MSTLTNIFYVTSIALMIPVMLALLFGLTYSLYVSGITIHEFVQRMKSAPARRKFSAAVEEKSSDIPAVENADEFGKTLDVILTKGNDSLLVGKKLADLESTWRGDLQKISDLAKYGPALGLMGTLIPLGPALVGLAEGDLATMSNNMIVAFATTVVGVLISLIALANHSARSRWYRDDSILLTFVAERYPELSKTNDKSDVDVVSEAA